MAGSVEVHPVQSKADRSAFLRIPWSLGMQGEPLWVPPMLDDHRRLLDPKSSPFLAHGQIACFIARQGDEPVGRISAQVDADFDGAWASRDPAESGVCFFGFFDCKDDSEVARALFARAEEWGRSQGRGKMRGPFTLDSKGDVGVLVEGFDTPPRIGTPYNLPYVGPLIESAGYAKRKDFYGWWFDAKTPMEPTTHKLAERVRALPNVRLRRVDLSQFAREVGIVRDVYNEAWSHKWCFTPFTAREIEIIAKEYKPVIDPDLVLIAEVDGEAAAICLAVPDLNMVVKDFGGELARRPWNLVRLLWRLRRSRPTVARLILLGVREKYRASRRYGAIAALLYEEVAKRGAARGYEGGELSWTIEGDTRINTGIERMGAKRYKTWRVYEKAL